METPTGNATSTAERRGPTIKIGSFTLDGAPAIVVLVLVLAAIIALIVAAKPRLGMLLSGALWIAFIVVWNVAARNAATTRSAESHGSRRLHELLLNGSLLLLFVPVPGLRARLLPASSLVAPVGLSLQAAFLLLAVWARRHLGRNWSGEIRAAVDHRLVRSGPYRLVRHPIYTAMLGMFAGTAVVSAELHSLIAVVVLLVAYWRKIRLEEAMLRATFGEAYDAYRSETWALIPGIL